MIGSGQRCCWPLNADPLAGRKSHFEIAADLSREMLVDLAVAGH
jgi:hypothetical protein